MCSQRSGAHWQQAAERKGHGRMCSVFICVCVNGLGNSVRVAMVADLACVRCSGRSELAAKGSAVRGPDDLVTGVQSQDQLSRDRRDRETPTPNLWWADRPSLFESLYLFE